jgi:hypothetical protein
MQTHTDDNDFFGLQEINDEVFTPPNNLSGLTQEQDILMNDAYSDHEGQRTPTSQPFNSQNRSERADGLSDESTNRVLD